MSLFKENNFPINYKPLEDKQVEKIRLEIANSTSNVNKKRNRNNSNCMINHDYDYKTLQLNKSNTNTKFSSQRSASGNSFFISNLKSKKFEKINKAEKTKQEEIEKLHPSFPDKKFQDFSDPNSVNQSHNKIKFTPIKYKRINSSTLEETHLTQSQSNFKFSQFLDKDLPRIYIDENFGSQKKDNRNNSHVSTLVERKSILNTSILSNLKSTSDKYFEKLKSKQIAETKQFKDVKKKIKGRLSKLINTSLIYSASQDPENRKGDINTDKFRHVKFFLPIKKQKISKNKCKEDKSERGRARRFEDLFITQEELIYNNFTNKEIEILKHQPDYSKIKNKHLKDVNFFNNRSLLELLTEEENGYNVFNNRKQVIKNSKSPFKV